MQNWTVQPICRRPFTLICVSVLFACLGLGSVSVAQENKPSLDGSVTGAGLKWFITDHWGIARATLVNPTASDQTYRVSCNFQSKSERQFAALVWVPARSKRIAEWPIRLVPGAKGMNKNSVEMRAFLLPEDASQRVDYDRQDGTLLRSNDSDITVTISDVADEAESITVTNARQSSSRSRRVAPLNVRQAPRHALGWDVGGALVLSADQPDFDAAQRTALREWVRNGGTLCVFADQVDPHAMQLLLGDGWGVQVIDQVRLTEVTFEATDIAATRRRGKVKPKLGPYVDEQPMRMARVIAPDYHTVLSVRGWPALMTRNYGAGRVVVITLEGRAWNNDAVSTAMRQLSHAIFSNADERRASIANDTAREFVSRQVVRPIVSRAFIGWVLGLFAVVIAVAGLWLRRSGRQERMVPVAIGVSVVVVMVLHTAGRMQRGGVDPTNAALQVIHADLGEDNVSVRGALGLYAPTTREITLASDQGGWVWPQARRSDPRRLIWQDLDRWQWDEIGVGERTMHMADYAVHAQLPQPVTASLSFNEEGLVGTIDWPTDQLPEDMIIAAPGGNLLVTPDTVDARRMKITLGSNDVLNRHTYFSAGLISPVRQARTTLLNSMFSQPGWPGSPMLVGWSDGIVVELDISGEAQDRKTALWTVPLQIQRPKPGSIVHVPRPFIQLTASRRSLGLPQMAGLYNEAKRDWALKDGTSQSSAFVARFMLPKSVLPIRPTEATLHLDMTAIGRPVRIVTGMNNRPLEVTVLQGPDGPTSIKLSADQLQVDDQGGVLIGFDVQQAEGSTQLDIRQSLMWRVRSMQLDVTGVVGTPTSTLPNE